MATRDIVPRANNEGNIGTAEKMWAGGYFHTVQADHITGTDGIYVQHYGALGDGVTDDSGAIQDAIDAAIAGGTVIIPQTASYYKVTATQLSEALTVSTRINLIINGELRATSHANQANPPFILNVTAAGTTISGIGTLRGNGSYVANEATFAERPGLLRIAADNVSVQGITFVNPQEVAVSLSSTNKCSITNCRFTGGPIFADISGSTQHFYIDAYGNTNLTISNNHFYMDDSNGSAIQGVNGSSDTNVLITDNQFNNIHEHSIYFYTTSGVLSNNIIRYTQLAAAQQGSAIVFSGDYCVVSNNTIYNALLGGISCRTGVGTIITGNRLYSVGYVGINVTNADALAVGLDHIQITNNYLKAVSSGTIYEGIRYASTTGMTAVSRGGIISGNVLDGWGLVGDTSYSTIAITGLSATYSMKDMKVYGNTITGSISNGIYLNNAYQIQIKHNSFINNPKSDFQCVYMVVATGIRVESNIADDYQDTPTLYSLITTSATTADVWLLNNEVYGATTANPFGHNATRNVFGRGNRTSRTVNLVGTFTMNNEATKVVNNANICDATLTDEAATVIITPLGANGALVMGSAKSLYVSATTAGTSFTVATSDGNSVPATAHVFAYEIIQ